MKLFLRVFVTFLLLVGAITTKAVDLFVPSQYATIQQAIDAASSGATIYVNPGTYIEKLTIINKSLTIIGKGLFVNGHLLRPKIRVDDSNNYTKPFLQVGWVIEILGTGSESVNFQNLDVVGGVELPGGDQQGYARGGFHVANANVIINDISIDGLFPWNLTTPGQLIYVINSTLNVDNLKLKCTPGDTDQVDNGLRIVNSIVTITNLKSIGGNIDHIIDIESGLPGNNRLVSVSNSILQASSLHWGECIRLGSYVDLIVDNCKLFRASGGDPWDPASALHSGIGISGHHNDIAISNNWIVGLPIGINVLSPKNVNVKLQNNVIENSEVYAVMIDNEIFDPTRVIDFGGGTLGSTGNNFFIDQTPNYHVFVRNAFDRIANTTMSFKQNCWSYPINLSALIYDFEDDPKLIKVDYGLGLNASVPVLNNAAPFFILSYNKAFVRQEDCGPITIPNLALNANDGNPNLIQNLTFVITSDNPSLFSVQPSIDASGTLTYTPAPDKNGEAILNIRLQDDGSNIFPNRRSSDYQYFGITINPVEDGPIAANGAVTLAEDQTYTFLLSDFNYYDGDGDPLTEIVLNNTGGKFKNNGVPIVDGNNNSHFTPQDIAAGHLTYTPLLNQNGINVANFTFTVHNNGDFPSASQVYTMNANVTAVNDKPFFASTGQPTVNFTTGQGDVKIATGVTVLDVDSPGLSGLVINSTNGSSGNESLQINIPVGSGISVQNNTGLTLILEGASSFDNYNSALASIRYYNTNFQACQDRILTIQAKDESEFSDLLTKTINLSLAPISNVLQTSGAGFCSYVDPPLIVGASPTGGNGIYTYQWQSSPNNAGPWTNIAGATSKDYNPSNTNSTIYFQRVVTSGMCANSTSNSVGYVQGLVPAPQNITTSGATTICLDGGSVTLSVTPAPGVTYQWKKNNNPIFNATSSSYTINGGPSNGGTYSVETCGVASSNTIQVSMMDCSICPPTPTDLVRAFTANFYEVIVSWTTSPGATAYSFEYRKAGQLPEQPWTVYPVLSNTINIGIEPNFQYEARVRVICGNGFSNYSSTLIFTGKTYCDSKGNSTANEWIDLVSFGTINRVSGSDAGYVNVTNPIPTLSRDGVYQLQFSKGAPNAAVRTEHWRAWIDFNRDGDFADAGEQVMSMSSSSTATLSVQIGIPSNATEGNVRMRVSMKYNAAPTSCETFSFGEVEDYTININSDLPDARVKNASPVVTPEEVKLTEEGHPYPNPVHDKLHLDKLTDFSDGTIVIHTITGAVVIEIPFLDEVDVSALTPGMHVMTITKPNGEIKQFHFIKQ